jgi:hypothetical protein
VILFKNIREKIGLSKLRKRTKNKRRGKALFNFDTSANVGVIFKTESQLEFEHIRKFLLYLTEKNNKVIALCFIDNKKVDDFYLLRKGFNFFTRKDLNLFFIPQHPAVKDFMEKSFDVLIDLSIDENFPMHYISSLSNSKFKIGKLFPTRNCFDLMIDTNKQNTVENLIENIKTYTSLIKTN